MRRITALVLALCMVFVLSACGITVTLTDSSASSGTESSDTSSDASSSGSGSANAVAVTQAPVTPAPTAAVTPVPVTPAPTAAVTADPVTPEPTAQAVDHLAEAEAQGIVIPNEFAGYTDSNNTFTFYTSDYDDGINMKARPQDGRSDVIGKVSLPFNGTLIGSCGSWYLVENADGQYFYIYSPIVNRIAISSDTASDDYSAILTLAASNGTTAPDGFRVQKGINGRMINDSGSEYYAIYKYHDPDDAAQYGTFNIINTHNAKTLDLNTWVTIYGYYNDRALVYHAGEFFWCTTKYFKTP